MPLNHKILAKRGSLLPMRSMLERGSSKLANLLRPQLGASMRARQMGLHLFEVSFRLSRFHDRQKIGLRASCTVCGRDVGALKIEGSNK